jgi:hypothetical protein
MIDDTEKAMALTEKIQIALPIAAIATKELRRALQEKSDHVFPSECSVTKIIYMGEEGGISCHLDFGLSGSKNAYVVSITHLKLNRRNPLTREIEAYCKHRIKRLKKLHGGISLS